MKILKPVSIAAALCCCGYAHAQAPASQAWPIKPVRVLVGAPGGGTSHILVRLLGAKLTEAWGQQGLSDPRPGANGNIAVEMMVRAASDGYTLVLMDIGNLSISPSMYKLPFDIIRDIAPITTVTYSPYLLTTHPSVPVKSVSDLTSLGSRPQANTPQETGKWLAAEKDKWAKVVKDSGLKRE